MSTSKPKKTSSGKWRIQVQVDGHRQSITKNTAAECRREYYRLKSMKGQGIEPREVSVMTLGEAVDRYIASRSNVLSPSTIAGYKRIRKNHFQDLSDKNIRSIRDWQGLVNKAAETTGAKTLKNVWGLIHASLKYAGVDVGGVSLPPVPKADRPWLQPEQIKVFVSEIVGHKYELIYLLALHSLRFSEIRALISTSISTTRDLIFIRGARVRDEDYELVYNKTNKTKDSTRDVPIMIPRLKELVKADARGYIADADESDVNRQLKRICVENGLPGMSVHCLRHTFASLCYHLQVPEMEAARLGGWSDLNTMHEIYTHLAEADKTKTAQKLKEFFAS